MLDFATAAGEPRRRQAIDPIIVNTGIIHRMSSHETTPTDTNPDMPADSSTGARARFALIAALVLLAAFLIFSAVANLAWISWLLAHRWLAALAVVIGGLAFVFAFDRTRAKNVAWRALGQQFGEAFGENFERKTFGTGRAQVGDHDYFGVRCFGSPQGLEISRIVSVVNSPVFIPWAAVAKIDTYPNLLTGRKGFETDMQAQMTLRDQPDLTVEVPWLTEYRQLLPKSVRYRSIKLSKK